MNQKAGGFNSEYAADTCPADLKKIGDLSSRKYRLIQEPEEQVELWSAIWEKGKTSYFYHQFQIRVC